MRYFLRAMLSVFAALSWTLLVMSGAAEAQDADLCHQATAAAERVSGVPDQLLDAISRVESGRYDPSQGSVRAWPWTINAEGQGHFYSSRSEAVAAARQFIARGIQSIDVGCTQINLMFHPTAFASLEDAFDPGRNATYAAHFLTELFHQAGSWPHAAAAYHSQTPELGTDYQRKVLEAWADPVAGSAGKTKPDHPAHHQPLASGPAYAAAASSTSYAAASASTSGSPIGRNGVNAPLGGFGRVLRTANASPAGTGRTLSAYRAMPVAMLMTAPRMARY